MVTVGPEQKEKKKREKKNALNPRFWPRAAPFFFAPTLGCEAKAGEVLKSHQRPPQTKPLLPSTTDKPTRNYHHIHYTPRNQKKKKKKTTQKLSPLHTHTHTHTHIQIHSIPPPQWVSTHLSPSPALAPPHQQPHDSPGPQN